MLTSRVCKTDCNGKEAKRLPSPVGPTPCLADGRGKAFAESSSWLDSLNSKGSIRWAKGIWGREWLQSHPPLPHFLHLWPEMFAHRPTEKVGGKGRILGDLFLAGSISPALAYTQGKAIWGCTQHLPFSLDCPLPQETGSCAKAMTGPTKDNRTQYHPHSHHTVSFLLSLKSNLALSSDQKDWESWVLREWPCRAQKFCQLVKIGRASKPHHCIPKPWGGCVWQHTVSLQETVLARGGEPSLTRS